MLRNSLHYCLALGVLLAAAAVARTQTPAVLGQPQKGPPQTAPQDLNVDLIKARMDRLEKQNLELMQQLQRLQMTPTSPVALPPAQSPATPANG